jgi:hypothetical protein
MLATTDAGLPYEPRSDDSRNLSEGKAWLLNSLLQRMNRAPAK